MRELVSVIIPAYNSERWIMETIESVLAQTHLDLEVIVVDDGSIDDTAGIVGGVQDPRVRLIMQANAGACAARNRGLEEAQGKYVQFLDADDLLSEDKIARQVQLLRGAPEGCVAGCGTVYFQDGENPEAGRWSPGGPGMDSDDPVQWLIDLWTPGPGAGPLGIGMVPYHAWFTPRELLHEAGLWDVDISQDQDGEYFTRVLLASNGVRWSNEGRVYYRKFENGRSLSGGRLSEHLWGRIQAVNSKRDHLLPRTTEINNVKARRALARQYRDIAYHAHPRFPDIYNEAEAKAAELGGYEMTFFDKTRLRYVERLFGWKMARRLSHAYRSMSQN